MDEIKQVVAAIGKLQTAIVRIETKLEVHADHEERIRRLEHNQARHQWVTTFATAGLTAFAVYLIQITLTNV